MLLNTELKALIINVILYGIRNYRLVTNTFIFVKNRQCSVSMFKAVFADVR